MKYRALIKNLKGNYQNVPWQRVLEHSRLARSFLKKGILLILDKVTKESCISLYLFLRQVYKIGNSGGWLYCALYLKQCSSSLKIAYGGEFDRTLGQTSNFVSLTGKGYPRIIPRHVRALMYKHSVRSDVCVQIYLTFFSFFSIVEKAKRMKESLFKTIRDPIEDIDKVVMWVGLLKTSLPDLLSRYLPKIQNIPLSQGMRWKPSWKVIPTYTSLKQLYSIFPEVLRQKSPFPMQTMELAAYSSLLQFIHSKGEQWSSGILFPHRVRYPFDVNNKVFSGTDLDDFESHIGPYLPPWHPAMGPPMTGKLAQSIEGGGKRRIFAIGNWVNQRLLTPVHQWVAQVLRAIPMDGTFNQTAPLTLLRGSRHNYCFDLTAATDRWPLVLMFEVMGCVFDRSFASAVVNSALACNIFFINFLDKKNILQPKSWISFVAGQPLGYRSSWPLFAFTHHLVVWWSAQQVYPGILFKDYALLGDDIVISDPGVAAIYKDVLSYLQVGISKGKTLVSHTGCAEFAKKFLVRDLTVDLSPVTLKALLGCHVPLCRFSLASKYQVKRYSTFRRLGGAGYKTCSRTPGTAQSDKEKVDWCLWLQLTYPSLEWFFGDGRPLPPTLRWWLMRRVLRAYRPPDFKVPPDNLFVSVEQQTFLEYTGLRCEVEDWLDFNRWWFKYFQITESGLNYLDPYFKVILDRTTFDEVFDAPFVNGAWRLSTLDHVKVRYTLLHRIKREMDALPEIRCFPILDEDPSSTMTRFNQWCHCEYSKVFIEGIGEYPFIVPQLGLIVSPEMRCLPCFSHRMKRVE